MKYTILLLLGLAQARIHFNPETEDALMNFEEDEDEADEHNGLPYTNKSIHDAYLLQLDETTQNGTNNAILIEAQDRVKNRQKFGEGCSLGEAMHTGTGLDIDDGEELLDDNAEYQNMGDLMNV